MREFGGTDSYSDAISDFYQDNFEEGIFTGKGIYNLEVFSEVLKDEIPEIIIKLINSNYKIYKVCENQTTLEDAFLAKTGGNVIE